MMKGTDGLSLQKGLVVCHYLRDNIFVIAKADTLCYCIRDGQFVTAKGAGGLSLQKERMVCHCKWD